MPEILKLGIDYGQGSLFGAPRVASDYVQQDKPAETEMPVGTTEFAAAS